MTKTFHTPKPLKPSPRPHGSSRFQNSKGHCAQKQGPAERKKYRNHWENTNQKNVLNQHFSRIPNHAPKNQAKPIGGQLLRSFTWKS